MPGRQAPTPLKETDALRARRRRAACSCPGRPARTSRCSTCATGDWVQFEHLDAGTAVRAAGRRRAGSTRRRGEVQVRFVNERQDQVGFQFPIAIDGDRPMTGIVRATRPRQALRPARSRSPASTSTSPRARSSGSSGPNGAGKTTTLRILATLLVPDRGRRRDRRRIRPPEPQRRAARPRVHAGLFGVYDDMKVWEYLDFFARCYGIPADRRRRMIGDLLELVDLGAKRDAYVQGLSRGMQQRLCLAHALVHDPQVLLLDEPASGLDPRARVELRELLRELRVAGQDDPHLVATSSPSSRSCAPRSRSSTAARCSPTGASPRSRSGSASAPCSASASWATARRIEAARAWFAGAAGRRDRGPARRRHDRDRLPRRRRRARPGCWPTPSAAGIRVATFARAASDLEELFLQVTAAGPVPAAVALSHGGRRQ